MFPLGTVLFPHAALPLRVFEPRYRQLMRDCLAGDREFGVVLIDRGSEVGGGDHRTSLGTVASIAHADEAGDGEWTVGAVGTRRIQITRWLDDDPYPRAEVEDVAEQAWGDDANAPFERAERAVRRSLAVLSEMQQRVPPPASRVAVVALSADKEVASWQLAALSPLGAFDRQRVLSVDDPAARLALLGDLAEDVCELLDHRLAEGQ